MKSDLLRAERIQHGWSQAQLAEELGVDTRTVRRWERGQAIPFPYYRQKLAILFGKTPEELGLPSDIYENDTMEEASPSVTQSNSSGTQASTTPSNQTAAPAQPSHTSEDTTSEISQQPIETLRTSLIEDHGLGSPSLDLTIDEDTRLQDELPATQQQMLNSLVGHVQAHQESMHIFGDQVFSFRSLWDFRIHMRHKAPSQPSKRFIRPLPLLVSTALLTVIIVVTILPALYQHPSKRLHTPDNYAPPPIP